MYDWQSKHEREWDCCGRGARGAEAAAWETLLAHEGDDSALDAADSWAQCSVIMDLVKALETVSLVIVW